MRKVSQMPLSRENAQRLIYRIAADSSRVQFVLPPQGGEWRQVVLTRQVALCLEQGRVISAPAQNEHGHWEVRLQRFCAGVDVTVRVAIQDNNPEEEARLFVLEVSSQ